MTTTATALVRTTADPSPDLGSLAGRYAAWLPALDRSEALSAVGIGWAECWSRHDPERGASVMTYAWGRMAGRCLDVQRAHHRQQRLLAHLARDPICASGAAPAPVRGITTDQLAVRQALVQVGPLSSAERLVVDRHYGEDQPLHEVAAGTRHSADSLQRAHRKLLGRLRTVLLPHEG